MVIVFTLDNEKYYLSHLYLFIVPCALFRAMNATVLQIHSRGVEVNKNYKCNYKHKFNHNCKYMGIMTEYNYAYKYNCIIQCSNLFTAPNKEYIEDFGPCYPLPEISNHCY